MADKMMEHVTPPCFLCNEKSIVTLRARDWNKWMRGTETLRVWPNMTPGERELMDTGTHEVCWVALFGDRAMGLGEPIPSVDMRKLTERTT